MAALEEGTREGLQAELDVATEERHRAVAGQKQAEQEEQSTSWETRLPHTPPAVLEMVERRGTAFELRRAEGGETIVAALRRWAQAQPEKALYTWLNEQSNAEQVWTYRELVHRANAVAHALRHKWGCAPGDRATLMYMPGLDFNAGFWGCLFAGVVAVPVYPVDLRPGSFQESVERFGRIVADCQPRLTLTHAPFMKLKRRMSLTHLFSAASWPEGLGFEATDHLEPLECAQGLSEPSPDALAFVQYTSGSTGNPKGVMLSHGNIKDNCDQMRLAYQFTEASIGVQWIPIYHDMGLIGGMITPTICGCRTVGMSPMTFLASPKLWLQTLSSYKATHSPAPNFAYELCLRKIPMDARASLDLSHMVMLLNGAEPITKAAIIDFIAGFRASGVEPRMLTPAYGLAEHCVFVCSSHTSGVDRTPVLTTFLKSQLSETRRAVVACGSEPEAELVCLVSVGKTMAQTAVCISQEAENGRLIPQSEGMVGEICLSSPSTARGYWGKPELSKETFQAKLEGKGDAEFLRTGDLGFLHQGELYLCGRSKDVIIINGRNHYPQDIERAAEASSPMLRGGCSAAFAVDINNADHVVLLAEIKGRPTDNDCQVAIEAIKAAIMSSQQLSCSAVLLLKERTIFKTTSGKIRRRACKQGFLAWCQQQQAARATSNQTSWTEFIRSGISGLCEAVLPVSSPGVLNVAAHSVNTEQLMSGFDPAESLFSDCMDGPGWSEGSALPDKPHHTCLVTGRDGDTQGLAGVEDRCPSLVSSKASDRDSQTDPNAACQASFVDIIDPVHEHLDTTHTCVRYRGKMERYRCPHAMDESGPILAIRGGQCKPHGILRGTFHVAEGLDPKLKVGLFAAGRSWDALMRFTSVGLATTNAPTVNPDCHEDMLSCGVKLISDGSTIHDLTFVNSPRVMPTLKHFTPSEDWEEAYDPIYYEKTTKPLMEHKRSINTCCLSEPWFSGTGYRFGRGKVVRYALFPQCEEIASTFPEDSDPNFLYSRLKEAVAHKDHVFALCVQFLQTCESEDVENWNREWHGAWHKVATLSIPCQSVGSQWSNDNIAFTAWNCLPEHSPIGQLNRARLHVYRLSANLRSKINNNLNQFPFKCLEQEVCVVGGGAAGLSAALAVSSFGYQVTVIEKQQEVGGHAMSVESRDEQGKLLWSTDPAFGGYLGPDTHPNVYEIFKLIGVETYKPKHWERDLSEFVLGGDGTAEQYQEEKYRLLQAITSVLLEEADYDLTIGEFVQRYDFDERFVTSTIIAGAFPGERVASGIISTRMFTQGFDRGAGVDLPTLAGAPHPGDCIPLEVVWRWG